MLTDVRVTKGAARYTRQQEIDARNQANRSRWACARAWLDHNGQQPRDFRTSAQRDAFERRARLYYFGGDDDYFEWRWREPGAVTFGYATTDGRSWIDEDTRVVHKVGEIDLGDVIFDECFCSTCRFYREHNHGARVGCPERTDAELLRDAGDR